MLGIVRGLGSSVVGIGLGLATSLVGLGVGLLATGSAILVSDSEVKHDVVELGA